MKNILTFFFVAVCFHTYAQDTLYVAYNENTPFSIIKGFKHQMDTLDNYPFDGGRIYVVKKKKGNYTENLRFSFRSYTPKWMDNQFSYQVVDNCIFNKKDFKGAAWFDSKTYGEIIKTFKGSDKIICLIDETEISNKKKIYVVRVYFSYDAEE